MTMGKEQTMRAYLLSIIQKEEFTCSTNYNFCKCPNVASLALVSLSPAVDWAMRRHISARLVTFGNVLTFPREMRGSTPPAM